MSSREEEPTPTKAVLDTDPLSETVQIPARGFLRDAVLGQSLPRLVVLEGDNVGTMVDIGGDPIVVGREMDVGLTLAEVGVSRRHARVYRADDKVLIEDLGSKNGTFLNRERIASQQPIGLADGDIIFIGAATLKFLAEGNVEVSFLQHLKEVGARDPLTQVANRRSFDDFMERELRLANLRERDLVMLIVDVDRFKSVNDTHGHLAGDMVLKELAAIMQNNLRGTDFLCRFGGEEFAIVLPSTTLLAAVPLAERLRLAVQDHAFVYEKGRIPITVSIGAGSWLEAETADRDALIARADARLYSAKQNGRNQVVFHD